MEHEANLPGANLHGSITRVANTVRRPTGPWTPAVHALLRHFEAVGFDGAPRVFGIDDEGREIVEYVEGEAISPWSEHRRLLGSNESLRSVGMTLRAFHDAVATFSPPEDAEWRYAATELYDEEWVREGKRIICHNDPGSWNLVFSPRGVVLIDWDAAGPAPPIWDLAYAVATVLPIGEVFGEGGWTTSQATTERVCALVDGYDPDLEDRRRLPDAISARVFANYDRVRLAAEAGLEPWKRLWDEGHGDAWLKMRDFAEAHKEEWRDALQISR